MKNLNSTRLYPALVFIFILTSSLNTHSQSLLEKVGAIKTNYIFTSANIQLPVQSQLMVKRGHSRYNYYSGVEDGYGYGYGMETWWLELISTSGISEKKVKVKGRPKNYYQFNLYDAQGQALLVTRLELNDVKHVSNGSTLISYSINLNNVPVILLDKAHEIRIDKISGY
ncbi:hypothetical protein [Carboxylicivirga sp. M1479]|uniref:hypothetical protein n=1 Tax=Carboxylicivirga sp. M1479 TaxID=2594476 RepID=UPI00117801B2|nr:hypothetical protein [Carboxylicivirga sp. M1479]TRX66165.1 hypothetical protein FNN09_14700 [Carboxylicivirga sp. M1479]